jgi:hypothetical protein
MLATRAATSVASVRLGVPGVYLALANRGVWAVFALCEINNLRGFNRAFSPIPTAPTIHLSDGWTLNKIARGQKGAD